MSRVKRVLAAAMVSALMVGAGALPALADDHLANASDQGRTQASENGKNPQDVPGGGDPKTGVKRGTPSSDNAKGGCCQNDHPRQGGQRGGGD